MQQHLLPLMTHEDPTTRRLAQLALTGDSDAIYLLRDLLEEEGINMTGIEVGKCYLVETVTKYWTGRVQSADFATIVLTEPAWIAETGRYHECLQTGKPSEVEPVAGPLIIPMSAVAAIVYWPHPLPREAV